MAFRLYLVPLEGSGSSTQDARRPKYFTAVPPAVPLVPAGWTGMKFGREPWMVVGHDLSLSDDLLIVGQADVFALPFDLSVTLTAAQVTNVQTKLEAINVPGGWVGTDLQWIEVVRIVLGMFSLMSRFEQLNGARLFQGGVTLATRVNQLDSTVQTNLTTAATGLGLTTAGITGTTTLRQALKILADQLSTSPFIFGRTSL